ncbi:MAG: DEAD/DEAH box helicase [Rhizobiaceae bacterium]
MTEFAGVAPSLASALNDRGYLSMTPVQAAVLKPEVKEADLFVSAQTGSGKTVAFGLAMGHTLLGQADSFGKQRAPLALIIAPTRELALQVKRELEWLYSNTGAIVASCVGGMDVRGERRALERGAHIVVGTPGRLRDHLTRGALNAEALRAVVLDEADEMLDLGFRDDLEFILDATPQERRTLLFSATVPTAIAKLAKRYQRNATRITTQEELKQHSDIEYRVLVAAPGERENAIVNVLRFYEAENALVFCNTRAAVNRMLARFNNRGFSVVALSGELSQSERMHALQALRDGRAQVCVATDVAARGIDLPKLDLVIHADLPTDPETLLHRSGRTGRAGRKGVSALMVDKSNRTRAERLLRLAKIGASWDNPPSADAIVERDEQRLFESANLSDEIAPGERDFSVRLLDRYSPEQVATALLRLSMAGKSAPEDIEVVSMDTFKQKDSRNSMSKAERRQSGSRCDFENSLWVTISLGRKQNAEPRWVIPMLCNVGGLSKADIGYIKIEQNRTHIELNADSADRFLAALGPDRKLEKNVLVTVNDGRPKFDSRGRPERRGGPVERKAAGSTNGKNKPRHKSKKSSSTNRSSNDSKSSGNLQLTKQKKAKKPKGTKRKQST